jgi:DNA-binding GntR family transcriptional regulator
MPPKRTGTDLIADEVFDKLRSRIITLEIKPGDRLVEDEICALLQAGRTPVREALLRLEGEGLVHRQRGWVVHSSDPAHFREIFETRIALEGYATRLAAERATAEDLAELEGYVTDMDSGERIARSEMNRLNQLFHRRIVELSGNEFFVAMHERTQFRHWNLRLPVTFMQDQLARTAAQHHEILAALKARDGDRAERAAREHIEATLRIVADSLHDD